MEQSPPQRDRSADEVPPQRDGSADEVPPQRDRSADEVPPQRDSIRPRPRSRWKPCNDNNLRFGCRGENVAELQRKIMGKSIELPFQDDGKFGRHTQAALKKYQKQIRANETGVYDDQTRNKEEELEEKPADNQSTTTADNQSTTTADSKSTAPEKKSDASQDSPSEQSKSSQTTTPTSSENPAEKEKTAEKTIISNTKDVKKYLNDLETDFRQASKLYKLGPYSFLDLPKLFVAYLMSKNVSGDDAIKKAKEIFGDDGRVYLRTINPIVNNSIYNEKIVSKIQAELNKYQPKISFGKLQGMKLSDIYPSLFEESKNLNNKLSLRESLLKYLIEADDFGQDAGEEKNYAVKPPEDSTKTTGKPTPPVTEPNKPAPEKQGPAKPTQLIDLNAIMRSPQYLRVKNAKENAGAFTRNTINEKFAELNRKLQDVSKKYNEGQITKQQISAMMDKKLTETKNTDDMGFPDAIEFKNSAINFINYLKNMLNSMKESKLHKNYFIDPIRNRHNKVEKLVFERLVKGCK